MVEEKEKIEKWVLLTLQLKIKEIESFKAIHNHPKR